MRLLFLGSFTFGRNLNAYVIEDAENTPERKQYYEAANLKRGADLILRVQRTINLQVNQFLTVGTIPIYRLQKSEIFKNGDYLQLEGTDGLTMNVFFSYGKQLAHNKTFTLTGGFPVIDRDYRPDGLTRTVTLSAQLSWKLVNKENKIKSIKNLYDPINP